MHAPARIQAGIGVLKNHLDASLQRAALCPRQTRVQILTIKMHLAATGAIEPDQQARNRALAAAGLTHQRQCLAPFNREAHAIDRVQELPWFAFKHTV